MAKAVFGLVDSEGQAERIVDGLKAAGFSNNDISVEGACRRARINKTTVYEWLKDETFRQELNRQRDEVIVRALDCLKANIAKASETLIKHLGSKRESISIRAAERIIEFTQKALEQEELERRIELLETRLAQQGENYR